MEKQIKKRPKPVVLVILDGWGINQNYAGNAITQAKKPFYDSLIAEYPTTTLRAASESVGLPWSENGNSEVGHLNLGLGRILYQDLSRINKEVNDRSIFKNQALLKAILHVQENKSKLHLIGMVSTGGVHASVDHLYALLMMAKKHDLKDVYIHAILDGRDTAFNSGKNYIRGIEQKIVEKQIGKIASVSGRFYAMDRNNNWDRTEVAYRALTEGAGVLSKSAMDAVEESYGKKVYDEEFLPTVITEAGKPVALIGENDAVIFFNYRPDRARQITKALILPDFSGFNRKKYLKNLLFVTFTEYEKGLPVEVAFPPEEIKNTLGEVISRAGLKQLRIAETEKYAHVTYFFNGGQEEKSPGEEHIMVPSPLVKSYDEKPEMSALEVTKKIVQSVNADIYDFILVNYANCDMVGHTGNIAAAIKAIEFLDDCLEKIVKSVLDKNGILLITADHGNAEIMFDMQVGQMNKEHTTNPVPFILVGNEYAGINFGWPDAPGNDLSLLSPKGILSDVAPTILEILGLSKPKEMRGLSLLPNKIVK
ncbi:MAG: 2,3-bisphosphoglycerate-independent phosphoglycerate mutase [Candidatus Falkowbacteria bacterium GW2011_GWC2_38_22]|uniref:2,3-bisphosphoglycerate-independent phosphoglycerate mutase n=1 Tax=Candidatus Falkowbacteria bacterium GW2011_GWE1_38_31 TaxID=1618638 RepID=A0A0G0JQ22_9BACT|nr:MAG: 2,3-bisphosphoglycerate-independent phosphoglycerate mutase [Candidatus Falkowbacteria bacterium GW2011_GWF2_38_1205]KKQ60681.1 MAG: 2,3-bisphosphoglycerate-independent phosphoglycerate mutase [Candidatus Falkowbacteria bacterium GW2011_GWC2_38_22]KKQ62821.1 MAG: 2,3-bisphosphoglycerate-independent phosphoglycerate mutase [Candidatus Falkowbacteria bacterium GW2011_GWF1_38_22]KKQ64933.1 MAG: 2,3-bisphosphoglycerate-independent phosphoglycerate mutase [Candidatus Falkowbacteria bacterium 